MRGSGFATPPRRPAGPPGAMAEAAKGRPRRGGRMRAWESRGQPPPWTIGTRQRPVGRGLEREPLKEQGRREATAPAEPTKAPKPKRPKDRGEPPREPKRWELWEGKVAVTRRPAKPEYRGGPAPKRRPEPSTPRGGRWWHPAKGCNPWASQLREEGRKSGAVCQAPPIPRARNHAFGSGPQASMPRFQAKNIPWRMTRKTDGSSGIGFPPDLAW